MRRVQLAANCNNRCVFCAQASAFHEENAGALQFSEEPGPDPALPRVIKLVGGEPTLAEGLERHIERFAAAGSRVSMQTNARLLGRDPELARALARAGLRLVEVALYGPTAAVHDYHTRVPGSFRETASGVKSAVAAGIEVELTTLVTRANFRHLADWVRLASVLGARRVELRSVLPFGRAAAEPRLEPPHELATPHIRAALEQGKRLGLECSARASTSDDFIRGAEPDSRLISIEKLAGAEFALADCSTHRPAAPRTGEWSPA